MRPEVVYNFRVTQLSCTGKDQLDVFRKCGVFNYILVGKRGFYRRRVKEIRMVVLMDIVAEGDGDKGRCNKDSRTEETTKDRCLMLGNLIPSTIPNSLIYCYEDFISNKIANGFYGDIFKVQHRKTGEIMVLKMNKPNVEFECCTMLEEIKLMSHLSHPNIIRFLGVCLADSRMHLLIEYVNGGELEELLLDYSIHLDWSTRLYLAKDIAEGMRYLHKEGVIHRDLTSKNCLIKERNGWRYGIVADLGLATEIKEQSIVGSPYNMAPELLRGEAYDEKADVFSYGIILCEIIGRVPADPDELPRTQKFGVDIEKFQHMTGDCPKEFLQTALCCCQMEPATRPTFTETAKHLEFTLVGYKVRPRIEDAMRTIAPLPNNSHSPEQNELLTFNDRTPESPPDESDNEMNSNSPPAASPPAIIVSAEATPPINFRTAEKRRQSWIAGRYKLFNSATDDLLKNTPGKLKNFFHRALRIQTQFHPSKQRKVKDSSKQRSASELKSFTVIGSDENLSVSGEKVEHGSSGSSNPSSSTASSSGLLRKKSSEQDVAPNLSLEEVFVDGRYSPQNSNSRNAVSQNSVSHMQPPSPSMLKSTPLPYSSALGSPMLKCHEETNRPRCESTPVFNERNSELLTRRTVSNKECEMNNVHSPEAHIKEENKVKNRKSPFRIFRRRGSKSKES